MIKKSTTLCIFCQNYCGKCAWTNGFRVVDGWQANVRLNRKGKIRRAWVGWCPEFIADDGIYKYITCNKADNQREHLCEQYGFISELRFAVLRYKFLNCYTERHNNRLHKLCRECKNLKHCTKGD